MLLELSFVANLGPGAGNHVLIAHCVVVQPHARDVTCQACVARSGTVQYQ